MTTNRTSFDFTGARALVTGGSSGIGHAVATAFTAAGASVTITGTRESANAYEVDLAPFDYRQLELRDRDAVDALAASVDGLDILVNNAGANFPDGEDEWGADAFGKSLEMNVAAAMRLTVGLGNTLQSSRLVGGASVVNLLSMGAFRAVPMVPGYCASKAALASLTQNLAMRWIDDGVRVNAVAPGLIDTPMTAPMKEIPEMLEAEMSRIPLGRMGTVDDVAGAVLYLSSSAAGYITGTVLAVDGGFLAR